MEHTITVTFPAANKVRAVPNPLPGKPMVPPVGGTPKINPGDTVKWVIEGGRELLVLFLNVRTATDGVPKPCSSYGPFSAIFSSAGQIVGTVRPITEMPDVPPNRRFLYKLLENGMELVWDNGISDEKAAADYGGIDIPMTPT